jgi:hypothetical protein
VADLSATDVPNVPDDVGPYSVGRYWVVGARAGNPDGSNQQTVYINWHTGEVRSEPVPSEPTAPRDLDDPLLRLRRPGEERGDYYPRREGRYALTYTGKLRLSDGRKTTVLSRCRHGCEFVDIVPGLVYWTEGSVVRGYAFPSGTRLRWPRHGGLFLPSAVGTAYELYIFEYIDDPEMVRDNPQYRTFVTRWRDALRKRPTTVRLFPRT